MSTDRPDRYLIVKRGLYYRPNSCGYTGIKSEAGVYPLAIAEQHADIEGGVSYCHHDDAPDYAPATFPDLMAADLTRRAESAEAQLSAVMAELTRANMNVAMLADTFGLVAPMFESEPEEAKRQIGEALKLAYKSYNIPASAYAAPLNHQLKVAHDLLVKAGQWIDASTVADDKDGILNEISAALPGRQTWQ